jgi:hypothetical protein
LVNTFPGVYNITQGCHVLHFFLGLTLVVPKIRPSGLFFKAFNLFFFAGYVKDAPYLNRYALPYR